jgi:DNA-binding transcriptional regulator YbjK
MNEQVAHRLITEIWSKSLKIPCDGATDFFTVGGKSLTASKIIASVNRLLNVNLPIELVYRHPRLEDFCRVASQYPEAGEMTTRD